MLRLTVCILITILLFTAGLFLRRAESVATLTRMTDTPEHAVNLNPTLSDDGQVLVFESSANLSGGGGDPSFHTFRTELGKGGFTSIANTRAVSPALSGDGRVVVFASAEDLVGQNADRNSEIFLFDGSKLRQITQTAPESSATRLTEGNFQPSVSSDGGTIVFSSNRDLSKKNADLGFEIFLYRVLDQGFVQLTDDSAEFAVTSPKISADGSRVYCKRAAAGETDAADLIVVETNTMTARVLASHVPELSLTEGRAVSGDGLRLVYSAATGVNQTQVFLYDGRENAVRQLTQLGSRSVDVKLQPTISGDGKRVAFATRRRVTSASDGGVELYLLDLPTGTVQQVTNAPSSATAEVVSSLSFDGSLLAFSFPRILSGPVSDDDFRNNSEIYLASIAARPQLGAATVLNAAALGNEAEPSRIAPGSLATIRGTALAFRSEAAEFVGGDPPFAVAGTTLKVNGQAARIFYVSPDEVVFVVPDTLASGPADFIVTNTDGFSSKAVADISSGAPGVFTSAGDGRGDAIILDAGILTPGPFDPSNGQLRISIFATGVSRAKSVTVTINSKSVIVEAVERSRLAGFDEIHAFIPAAFAGAGASKIVVNADGVRSNSVSLVISGSVPTPSPTPTPSPSPSPSSPNGIVISQIFGGGGNSGAPFRNDFIEIFNGGNSTVNLAGWSVQYASATASNWSVTALTSVVLAPGQYYLIQESSGGSNGSLLPAPDATGTIAMAAASGKVALVRNSNALAGACPNDPNIVDLVGYGTTANCFRGSAPVAAPSNTNAALRKSNGCTDTRNNVSDFALGPPNPRNTNFSPQICSDQ